MAKSVGLTPSGKQSARQSTLGKSRFHASPPAIQHADLVALQGAAGNAAVASLLSGGSPLDPNTRAAMEARFGESFDDVRVHADHEGDTLAREHSARAITHGRDVAFREGEYAPDTLVGHRLLAHELAHVVQQRRGGTSAPSPHSEKSDSLERDARSAADAITTGAPVSVSGASAIGLAADKFEDDVLKQLGLPPKDTPIVVDLTKLQSGPGTGPAPRQPESQKQRASVTLTPTLTPATATPPKKLPYTGAKLAPDQEWAAEALGLDVHPERAPSQPAQTSKPSQATPATPAAPAKKSIGVDYKADPRAFQKLELAYTADYSVEHVQTRGVYKSSFYWIVPHFRSNTDAVVFYGAYNPEMKRTEYIIGPNLIKEFLSNETLFRYNAAGAYPLAGDMPEYKAKSARVAARAMEGDAAGAWKAWKESWVAAAKDPNFWVEATVATSGGLAGAAESGTARAGVAAEGATAETATTRTVAGAAEKPPVTPKAVPANDNAIPLAANDNAIPPSAAQPKSNVVRLEDYKAQQAAQQQAAAQGVAGDVRLAAGAENTPVASAGGAKAPPAPRGAPQPPTGTAGQGAARVPSGPTEIPPNVPVKKLPPGPKPPGQKIRVAEEPLPEGTQGVSKNPPGAKKQSVGSQVGNWSHQNFEKLDSILLPEAENLTGGKLPPGLAKEVEVPVPELPPGKRPRMDRVDHANAEIIEIKPKNLEKQGFVEAQGYAEQMNRYSPRADGRPWKPRVVTYDYDAVEAFLRKIRYLE